MQQFDGIGAGFAVYAVIQYQAVFGCPIASDGCLLYAAACPAGSDNAACRVFGDVCDFELPIVFCACFCPFCLLI